MIAAAAAWIAKSALMQSPIGGFLKAIPRWAWILLAGVALALLAVHFHSKAVQSTYDKGHAAGVADEEARAAQLNRSVNAQSAAISTDQRSKSNAENIAINRGADDQRLHGPGKAACPPAAQLAGGPGRHGAADGRSDAAVDQVPDGDWAAVPWGWLVDSAEQCDLNRAEANRWREWWKLQGEAWAKAQGAGATNGVN